MLLRLDFSSATPIYLQIRNQIVLGIASGSLAAGEKLPTIRALAAQCGVNMMTVSRAYQLLRAEGYIVTDRRSGAAVRADRPALQYEEKLRASLRLGIAEAKLAGMSRETLLLICGALYDEAGEADKGE